MIVNCDKCNTAYQVDETQVGPQGLSLKCASCQNSFRVVAKTFYLVEGFEGAPPAGSTLLHSPKPVVPEKPPEERKPTSKNSEGFDAAESLRKFGQIAPASSPTTEVMDSNRNRYSERKTSWGLWFLVLAVVAGGGFFFWKKKNPDAYQRVFAQIEEQSQSLMDHLDSKPKINEEARSLYMQGKGAFALDTQSHYLEAIDFYRKAVNVDPNYAAAHGALAEAALEAAEIYLDNNTVLARDYLDEALRASTKANTLDPHNLEGQRAMAAYERIQGNFVKSQDQLNALLASNPTDSEVHVLFARNYLTKDGLEDMAQEYLRKAITINDLSIRAHRYLALTYEKKNQGSEALKEWQKVLDLNAKHELAVQKIAAAESTQKSKPIATTLSAKSLVKEPEKAASVVPKIVSTAGSHPEEPHEAGPSEE